MCFDFDVRNYKIGQNIRTIRLKNKNNRSKSHAFNEKWVYFFCIDAFTNGPMRDEPVFYSFLQVSINIMYTNELFDLRCFRMEPGTWCVQLLYGSCHVPKDGGLNNSYTKNFFYITSSAKQENSQSGFHSSIFISSFFFTQGDLKTLGKVFWLYFFRSNI